MRVTAMAFRKPVRLGGWRQNSRWAWLLAAMLPLASCGERAMAPVVPPTGPSPADYSLAENWESLPNASQGVDVFFVYPTEYGAPAGTLGPTWTPGWNVALTQAYADPNIKASVTTKASVFAKAGTNLYVPYYQQASGLDVLNALLYGTTPQNVTAANEALNGAYNDVAHAFDYYMAHFNKDANGNPRPFILAGHSQGSNLLLMLLQNKFSDPSLRKLLVAAYVIGWSVTSEDMNAYPDSLGRVGICGIPASRQTGCIVTWNTQDYAGDWSMTPGPQKIGMVQKNAYSVNPLTWVASGPGEVESPGAQAAANPGAVFYSGQLGASPTVTYSLNPDTGEYTYEIGQYTGARNNDGALVIDTTKMAYPGTYSNLLSPWDTMPFFHIYDYTFFYRSLEQNAIDRINAYKAQ